jgi:uncharacterized protein (TIGR03382 family)
VLLFLARLSFAAEESPTCGDGDELTLTIGDQDAETYDWRFGETFFDWGGEVLDTTGPTATIRCPQCVDGESHRWDVQVQMVDANGALSWGYTYFEHTCPALEDSPEGGQRGREAGCASAPDGSIWLALLALAFRRRRA